MATIRCVVEVKNNRGEVVDRFPSTQKTLANKIGKARAKQLAGTFEVSEIEPVEFDPQSW